MTKKAVNKPFTAFVTSNTDQQDIHSKVEKMGNAFISLAQKQVEDTVHTAQELLNCRTFEDITALHERFMQQSFDRLINEANKMTQKAVHLVREKTQPLSAKIEDFVQSMSRTA